MSAAIVIQHHPAEGLAAIADAFARHGVEVTVVRADRGDPIPGDLSDAAALVVMGGPMSATSDDGYPTRTAELALVRRALERGTPTLGVCLGAQLLAVAAGGAVVPGDGPEIGWGPVRLLGDAASDPLLHDLPETLTVLHWHGETYTLPPASVHLARSSRYEQQAFRVGDGAWGLQFHVEVDHDAVAGFVAAFPEDADHASGGRVGLLAATPAAIESLVPHRERILDRFARLAL